MSGGVQYFKGIPLVVPNTVYKIDEVSYVSYNNRDIQDYGCDTTALVREDGVKPTKFLILNGNHVKELLALGSYEKGVEYFKEHIDSKNKNSENWDEEFCCFGEGKFGYRKVSLCE